MMLHDVFLTCAAVGGSLLVIQTILTMVGGDASDADGVGDHADSVEAHGGDGHSSFFGQLSLRTVVAFLTFFGLGGWMAEENLGFGTTGQIGVAVGMGLVAFYIVGFVMVSLGRLESSGTVDLNDAVGTRAQVYLVIPAKRTGAGKVTITLKSQSLQISAVTAGEEIRTGQQVEVIAMSDPTTYEVVPA